MTEFDHRQVIAIDGPAAAGKSTVALALAHQLGALLFDTGSLYRAVTLAAIRAGVPLDDGAALAGLAESSSIELRPASIEDGRVLDVCLNGDDVTWAIRTPEIDAHVSQVAAHPAVRSSLLQVQRSIADGVPVVMVGRDIGTVVTPEAGTKIYLDASAAERARRRVLDLRAQGQTAAFDQVLADIEARDGWDSTRATAPLRQATDAVVVDTDNRSVTAIVATIKRIVEQRHQMLGVAT